MDEATRVNDAASNEKGCDGELKIFEKEQEDPVRQTISQDEPRQIVIGVLDRRTEYKWLLASFTAMFLCGKQAYSKFLCLQRSSLIAHRRLERCVRRTSSAPDSGALQRVLHHCFPLVHHGILWVLHRCDRQCPIER